MQPCAAASQLDAALGASPPCNALQPRVAPHSAPHSALTVPLQPLTAPYSPTTASYRPLGASLPDGGFLCFDDEECAALSAAELAAAFSPASRSAALACLCFYRLREPGE